MLPAGYSALGHGQGVFTRKRRRSITFDDFNRATPDRAAAMLLNCAPISRWVEQIVAARPYASPANLVEYAAALAKQWRQDEVDIALRSHPRIGERPVGQDAQAAHSRLEQRAVDGANARLAAELHQANAQYEQRFGHVFIIRAGGRSGDEILALLHRRLANSPMAEKRETAIQLREIALLRLQKELTLC